MLKVDDPVGAISVHGFAGAWGTLAVGLFAQAGYGGVDGLFFGGGIGQLGTQMVGVIAAFAFVFPSSYLIFRLIDATVGMRASDEDQIRGLDISEHAAAGYPDFAPSVSADEQMTTPFPLRPVVAPSGGAVDAPLESSPDEGAERKM